VPYEADSAARSFGEAEMLERFPDIDTLIYESGGDNLTLTFSPALADVFVFVLAGTALTSAVHHLLTGARAAVIRKS